MWTAPSSGNIVPNDRIQSGGTTVEINLGGVTVNDRADIDYLVNELARRMQLGKL